MTVTHFNNCEDRETKKDEGKSDEERGVICSICLEEIQDKDAVESEPCEHIFHENCIWILLSYSISCPVCRAEIQVVRRVNCGTLMDMPEIGVEPANNRRNIGMRRYESTEVQIQRIRDTIEDATSIIQQNNTGTELELTPEQQLGLFDSMNELYDVLGEFIAGTGLLDSSETESTP